MTLCEHDAAVHGGCATCLRAEIERLRKRVLDLEHENKQLLAVIDRQYHEINES